MSTALEIECPAVIPLEQSPLLAFQSPLIDLRLTVLLPSRSFNSNAHLIYVLISSNNLSAVIVIITLPLDSLSVDLFFIIGAIVLEVFQLLLNLFFIFITLTLVTILIFIVIVFFSEFLEYLNILSSRVLIERLAAVMDNVYFPMLVDNVVVMEGSMRIENEQLNTRVMCVVPQRGLIDKTTTVDEQETSHKGVPLKLFQLIY
jgi:hypothetical protein